MTMATLEQQTAAEQSWRDRVESARCLLSAFDVLGMPETMLDVGCGRGHLVYVAHALGVEAAGGDITAPKDTPERVSYLDLTEPWPRDAVTWEMVLCLEVAEHLPASAADTLCDTLAATTGRTLVFSAATPGQGGSGHLNEQPHRYWVDKLEALGLRLDERCTFALRSRWKKDAPGAWWYAKNCLVFRGAP